MYIFSVFTFPGCDGNGARFGSCVGSGACTAASSCTSANEEYCYISQACQPKGDPCSCVGRSDAFCSSHYKTNAPTYILRGQTFVDLPAGAQEFYSVTVDIDVEPNYILAFQTNTGSDVIQCDTSTGSSWEQNAAQVIKMSWLSTGDTISTGNLWKNNTACYFQAVVTGTESETLPSSLQYFTKPDTYTYTVSAPSLSIAKTCSVQAEEKAGQIQWIHPVIQSSMGAIDTIYVQHDVPTYLVFGISAGSHLTAQWQFSTHTNDTTFETTCPSTIETAFPTECNATNYWPSSPFTYRLETFDWFTSSSTSLTITVGNDLTTTQTKIFSILIFLPITGLALALTTPNANNLVEKGVSTDFSVSWTMGIPTSYKYSVNGTVITPSSSSSTFSYSFPTKSTYVVEVEATDGLNVANADVTVEAREKAQITGLVFDSTPAYMALNTAYTLTVTGSAQAGVSINTTFYVGSSVISFTSGTSTASLTQTASHTFTTTGIYAVNVTIVDDFGVEVHVDKNIEVQETIPSVSFSASTTLVEDNTPVSFTAGIPAASQSYGDTRYTFEYGDGNSEVNSSLNTHSHTFTAAGSYNVTVVIFNGVSSVTAFVVIEVQEMITNLSLTGTTVVLLNATKTYTATYSTGTNLQFEFEAPSFGLTQGPSTSSSFSVEFTSVGTFNITVRVFNDIDSKLSFLEVQVISADTLQIQSITHERYKAINEAVTFTISVLHHDTSVLTVTWQFGDSNSNTGTGLLTTTHAYSAANDYNVSITVQDTTHTPTTQDQTSSTVTAVERITGLSIANDAATTGAITTSSNAMVTVSATVATGTRLQYEWTYDGNTQSTGSTPSISVTYSTIGSKTVSLNVSNEIESDTVSTTFEVQQSVEGLSVACADCVTDANGNHFFNESVSTQYTATITSGSDVSYTFDFGDSTTRSGTSASYSHAYTTGNYTLTVTASNNVSSLVVTLAISAQSPITSIVFPNSMATIALINSPITYSITVTGGSDLNYKWKYCRTCSEIHSTSNTITNSVGYSAPDYYYVSVNVYNMISTKTETRQLVVLKAVTAADLTTDLISGQYAQTGTQYTFNCQSDSDYPIIYYYWKTKEDGGSYSAETQIQNYTHTFSTAGTYKANCRATNLITTQQEEMTIYVQEAITSPVIQRNHTGIIISTGDSVHLTAQTSSGTDLRYLWTVQYNGSTTTLSSMTNEVTYTFATKGTYVFSVNISNNIGFEVATALKTAMEAIDGIGIDTDIGATSPYLAKDTTVVFTLTITQGESYTVAWTVKDSLSTTVTTGSTSTLSYQFTMSGTYTAEVTVTNTVSQKDTQLIIYVQVPLTSLTLSGSVASVKTSEQVTFTASHNTDATHLSYNWLIDGASSTSTGVTKLHTFNTPGTYTVIVSVNNNISNFTAQTSILAQDEITGLAITGCDTTAVENTNVLIVGSVTTGTDVIYTWTSSSGLTSTGATFNAVFTPTGIYTVTVNASNVVDTSDKTCTMEIIGVISNIQIILQSSSIFFTTYQVNFLVSGHNLVGVTYEWEFTGATNFTKTTSTNLHAETFTVGGNYTLNLNVSNAISYQTAYIEMLIRELTCAAHSMTRGGVTSKTIFRASPSIFEIVVDTNSCDSYKLAYTWTVYQDTCAAASSTTVTLPNTVFTTSSKLIIPGQTMDYGSFCVKAKSEFIDTPLSETVEFDLTIIPSDPVALLAGGSSVIDSIRDIELDGSLSYDPDNSGNLTYSWTCSVTPVSHVLISSTLN